MTEEPFIFANGASPLFGVLHAPPEGVRRLPYVFCHPFGEEKLWTHRVLVSFARDLSQRGHPVLRFDCMGNGDSSGAFEDSSVRSALSDIEAAIEVLKARFEVGCVGLLGLRLGATLAALIAESRDDVSELVMWAPILDGERYANDLLRVNLTTQMAVFREIRVDRAALIAEMKAGGTANVDGYEVSLAMYQELVDVKLGAAAKQFSGRCLIVETERVPSPQPSPGMLALQKQYANAELARVQEEPFWKEIERFYESAPNLARVTTEWLR